MPIPLIGILAAGGAALLFANSKEISIFDDNETEKADSPNTLQAMPKTVTEQLPAEPETVIQTDIQDEPAALFRRGDRFTCPETGEQLQVRAIGGRPRKDSIS